jgi:hypothetical protein
MSVQSRSDNVNTSLFDKREHIEKLHRTCNLLRKVQVLKQLSISLFTVCLCFRISKSNVMQVRFLLNVLVSVWSLVVYTIVLSLVYLWMTDILSTLSKSSLYTIFLIDLASASSQRRMQMQSGFTSEQCQFLRLFFAIYGFYFNPLIAFTCNILILVSDEVSWLYPLFIRHMEIHHSRTVRKHLKRQ